MFCDMNDHENTTIHCHERFKFRRLPGQKHVYTPKECFNDLADEEGYCRGKPVGSSCSNNGHADCDVDLYCEEPRKVCVPVGKVGDACTAERKCASYLLCAWEDGLDFRCRNYGTYPNGKTLGPGDEDDICQSNYIDQNYLCSEGPRLTSPHLREAPGESCHYTVGSEDRSHCWYQSGGKAICKRGAGDLMNEWKTSLAYLLLQPSCHVTIPMAQCDMGRKVVASQEEWEKIWFAISKLHWDVHLEGLAQCMKQYVHPETFKYEKSSFGNLISVSTLSLFALLLILL